jgi:hypothetical protein
MYVYLQAYEPYATGDQPVVAFVGLYDGRKKVFETQPVEAKNGSNDRLKTTPIQFSMALEELPPGKYDFQVTILDPTGQKAAFWQAPIVLVP